MVGLARLMVGSVERAEELVQDAFVAMLSRFADEDLPENPGGYLRTSVVNGCRGEFRHRDVVRRVDPLVRHAVSVSTESSPLEMTDAVLALPQRQRAAIALRFYADYTEAQIADALGVRPGTVKALIHQGLNSLRGVIARD